jgi:hypothetical protein
MGEISSFSKEETKLLVEHLQENKPHEQSSVAVAHNALIQVLIEGRKSLELTLAEAEELHFHLRRTGPRPPGGVYLEHLFVTGDIESMTEEGIKRQRRTQEAFKRGGFAEAIGVGLGAVGYGERKSGFSGKPSPESRTLHEIKANFSNPHAKSQLLPCKSCGVKTRHTTPFAGYPFQCVVNHKGTTKCDGCGYDVEFIARVIVTGQHEHKSYCLSCDELNQTKGEVT